ncbi:MAG: substrate-binding domain-containing protein [Spirochaetaceae bacterium]|jgi:ABC-type sugar transport system substrate-binding protein|nr:substrate-binding domain-containing protein [Spirochaetaceae bacterium]
MQTKKIICLLCAALIFGVVLGGGNVFASGNKETGNTVYVFGPTPDHGWTGSAARFAEEKIAQLNAAGGKFKYVFRAAGGPDDQIKQIEAVMAESKKPAGVVIQASDNMVEAAVEQIAKADIPLILFDRLLDGTSPLIRQKMLIAMSADNYDIGAGAAYYMVQKGMNPGDAIWELPGDNSAVSVERGDGFREYLTGKRPFIDDQGQSHTVPADKEWTDAQIKSAITTSQVANWSRDNAKTYFESYIAGKTPQTLAKWFWTMDDEFVMGILELLQTPAKAGENALFESNVKVITGCGGLTALYDVMGRTKSTAGNQLYQPDGVAIMSPTCRPGFFVDAIQLMDDHLNGKDITVHYTDKAAKRFLEPPHLVDTASWAANKNNPSWRGFD